MYFCHQVACSHIVSVLGVDLAGFIEQQAH